MLLKKIYIFVLTIFLLQAASFLGAIEIPLEKDVKGDLIKNFSSQLPMDKEEFIKTIKALKEVNPSEPEKLETLIGASRERAGYLVFRVSSAYAALEGDAKQKEFYNTLEPPFKVLDEELKIARENKEVYAGFEASLFVIFEGFMKTPEMFRIN